MLGALAVVAAGLGPAVVLSSAARADDKVFTVGNYPVDATAQNAVAAKEKALADGQQAAFRSLMKRLVPVTQYNRIKKLQTARAADYLQGVAVRSESNSSTQYIASLDFSFQPQAVRELLRREGVPFVEAQAPAITVAPVELSGDERDAKAWLQAWRGLDNANALAPFKLEPPRLALAADTIRAALAGDAQAVRSVVGDKAKGPLLIAAIEADSKAGKLVLTLAGEDAVGPFRLVRGFRMPQSERAYTVELAAVVTAGILEGRWKAARSAGASFAGGASRPVQLFVEYRSLQQWQAMRGEIAATPGLESMEVGGVSARGADVAVRYPGGGEALATALTASGYEVRSQAGVWVVRRSF
jgi:hypothetical protein